MLTVNLASRWQSYRMPSYRGYRFPPEIISHAVWLHHRFALSFRDVEDLLARRGVDVTYEAMWMRTVTSSTSSCNRDGIGTPRCASFARC